MEDIVSRLKTFIENEMRSCSMDIGGITPEYVYRMWGGKVAFEEIAEAMEDYGHTEITDSTERAIMVHG